ncbi:MAG: hypothetical protein ACYCTV_04120 [Leptospirales bacterium]
MEPETRYRVIDPYNDDVSYTFTTREEAKEYINKAYPAMRRAMAYVFKMEEVGAGKLVSKNQLLHILQEFKRNGVHIETESSTNLEERLGEEDVAEFADFFQKRFQFFRDT